MAAVDPLVAAALGRRTPSEIPPQRLLSPPDVHQWVTSQSAADAVPPHEGKKGSYSKRILEKNATSTRPLIQKHIQLLVERYRQGH